MCESQSSLDVIAHFGGLFVACCFGGNNVYLTLAEWNARQPRPKSAETVRRWVRECRIVPAPVKDGREYLFEENAVKINPAQMQTSGLLKRIRNGESKKT